jgi:hypothetical protein
MRSKGALSPRKLLIEASWFSSGSSVAQLIGQPASLPAEPGEEGALGASVAFAERMQSVDVAVEFGYPTDEVAAGETAKVIAGPEAAEDLCRVGGQVLERAERGVLGYVHRAQFARPVVQIAEDRGVETT